MSFNKENTLETAEHSEIYCLGFFIYKTRIKMVSNGFIVEIK